MLPVYGAGVEGEGGEVGLADQGPGKVPGYVALLGEEDGVPTQLRHNVLSEGSRTKIINGAHQRIFMDKELAVAPFVHYYICLLL